MADIFGRQDVQRGGALSADATTVTFSNFDDPGLILRQLSIDYSQQVSRLYGLENGKVYYVAGRTDGSAQANQVIGPEGANAAFYTQFGDVCNVGAALNLTARNGCFGAQGEGTVGNAFKLSLTEPVIVAMNLAVNADDMIINTGLRMSFVSLKVGGSS